MAAAEGAIPPQAPNMGPPKSPQLRSVMSDLSTLDLSFLWRKSVPAEASHSFESAPVDSESDGSVAACTSSLDTATCHSLLCPPSKPGVEKGSQGTSGTVPAKVGLSLLQSSAEGSLPQGTVPSSSVGQPCPADAPSSSLQQSAVGSSPSAPLVPSPSPSLQAEPVTCQVACFSWAGSKEGFKKTNQDSYAFMRTRDKRSLLFGVFDGHGPNGSDASQLVKQRMPEILMGRGEELLTDTSRVLTECFETLQEEMVSSGGPFDSTVSGTTAVVAHLFQRTLSLAWAGDSRAVLGRITESGELVAVDLTHDHKPEQTEEKERIEASNGCVYRDVNELGEEVGPHRVWMKQGPMLGLAMSRSLGDRLAHSVGVSSTPETTTFQLTPEDHFMIIASDGIWEFVSSIDAAKIVNTHRNPNVGVKKLMHYAREQWLKQDLGSYVDDITALVVHFKHNN